MRTGLTWIAPVACFLGIVACPVFAQEQEIVFGSPQQEEARRMNPAAPETADSSGAAPVILSAAKNLPRLELHIPSLHNLVAETRRSHSGFLLSSIGAMLFEMGTASSEGVDVEEAAGILGQAADWPDTAVDGATYAPDIRGRLRWAVRLDWPLSDLHRRVKRMLASEAAETLFEGVALKKIDTGGYELALPESSLAYLLPGGGTRSYIASHPDLKIPARPFTGTPETTGDQPVLLVARLNLIPTEEDSGATVFSSFRIVTAVEYAGRVNEDGDWDETVHVYWPPVAGLGAKAIFGKVKQTFFVPNEAFGAITMQPMGAAAMLDGMAGFGPQMMMEDSGEFSMVGEVGPGPLARRAGPDACITLLPGTGFLPVPDIVAQLRTKKADKFIEDVRAAAEKINALHRDREQPEAWHEIEVKDRPVFWNDRRGMFPGSFMPFVMRPVLFTTRETDARDKQRDFVVVAWTSTSPQRFARRWLEMPRNNQKFLPSARKTHGQVLINWKQAYKWIHPYINLALSAVVRDTLLPGDEDLVSEMGDAWVTLKVRYSGLHATHRGPIPIGTLVVPMLLAASTTEDRSGGSDLARERLAARRLGVLYHHCILFKKDQGRWPAELAELDGYVDFAGHPELLKLQLSSSKRWSDFFKGMFQFGEDEEESDDQEDQLVDIDDELYVIDWGPDNWSLGLTTGTLEHLQRLYIDQDGEIHRVEKEEPRTLDEPQAKGSDS